MFGSFFEPGSLPFWVLCAVTAYLAIRLFAEVGESSIGEAFFASGLVVSGAVVLVFLFGTTAVFDWIYTKDSPMFTLFAFGGWCFYLLMVAELLGLMYCMRSKRGISAAISIMVTVFLLQVFGGLPVVQFIWANKLASLVIFIGYFVVGGGMWSLWKWSRFSKRARDAYEKCRAEFLIEHGLEPTGEFPEELWPIFKKKLRDENYNKIEFFPDFRSHKSEILGWIVAWPLSILESFVLDFLLNLADWVYKRLSGAFEYITRFHWRQFDADRELDLKLKKKI